MNAAHQSLLNEISLFVSQIGGLPNVIDTPGLLYTRDGRPVMSGTKGTADKIDCIKGRFVGIEVKTGKGSLSTAQRNWGKAVERAGGIFICARSVDDVRDRLEQEGLL